MKKLPLLHRLTGLILSILLIVTMLPVRTFAANDVASVNGKTYTDIAKAWEAAVNANGTITMLSDWSLNTLLHVKAKASVTLNMEGHMINRGKADTEYYGKGDGQIFYVEDEAELTINGGEGSHNGYLDGDLWLPGNKSGKTSLTLNGGILTRGACDDSDGAGAITMRKKATVTLNHVNVVGNVSDSYLSSYGQGGAVRMVDPEATLNLNDSKIMYNHAESHGGGVYIQDDHCTINMDHSEISHNFASGNGGAVYSNDTETVILMTGNSKIDFNRAGSGGGIYLNYSKFAIRSSDSSASISNNKARDGHGGGVHVEQNKWYKNYGVIHGISFRANSAKKYGGAIYIDQESINISNCLMEANGAKTGGGIYNNNDLNTITGCIIQNNVAETSGGGVFSSCLNNLGLSGKVVIKNNNRTDSSKDDLYLNDTFASTAYLNGAPSGQSEVGIRTEKPQERKLGTDVQFFYEDAFFYDQGDEYHIEFVEDKGELWLKKGAKEVITKTEVSPETTQIGTYNGQPLIQGVFSYPSFAETEQDLDAWFFYTDGYFLDGEDGTFSDPTNYNEHLATMSMSMAMAGFYSNIGNDGKQGDRQYLHKQKNIYKLLADIGVPTKDIYISESNFKKPETDSIGVAIGSKYIGNDGEILIPISVRGAGYEAEWYGNTSIGTEGEHEGFSLAAEKVFNQVQDYISDHKLDEAVKSGKVKFWIAGYSRAGATSNLAAKRLVEEYCNGKDAEHMNHVYAYCFEAPKGGLNTEMLLSPDMYECIHNCINNADLVPLVAPEEMGFIRYGVDHYIPGSTDTDTVKSSTKVWSFVKNQEFAKTYETWSDNAVWSVGSKEYNAQRAKMLSQLKSVDPTGIYFYDRFDTATVNYFLSTFGGDMIKEKSSSLKQEQFIRLFVRAFQAWGLYGCYDGNFRSGITSYSWKDGGGKFQEALQLATKILFGKTQKELDGIMNAAGGIMERIGHAKDISKRLIWDDLVGDWCSLTQEKREDYANTLWRIVIEERNIEGVAVQDFLTAQEKKDLQRVWYTLLDVVLRFVASDYKFNASKWNESHAMVKAGDDTYKTTDITEGIGKISLSECQVLLGTLAFNASAVMQAHYPEINFAWLRSYDSFYANEEKNPIQVKADAFRVDIYSTTDGYSFEQLEQTMTGTQWIKVVPDTVGAESFLRILDGRTVLSDWQLCREDKYFMLEAREDKAVPYTLEIVNVYCDRVTASGYSVSIEPGFTSPPTTTAPHRETEDTLEVSSVWESEEIASMGYTLPSENGWFLWAIIPAVLAVAIIVLVIIIRKKKKKLSE